MRPACQMAANNIQLQLYLAAMLTWGFCTCLVVIWQFPSPWFRLFISRFSNKKTNWLDAHFNRDGAETPFWVDLLSAIISHPNFFQFHRTELLLIYQAAEKKNKKSELCRQKKKLTMSTIVLHIAQWHIYPAAQLLPSTPERDWMWQRAITSETHQMYTPFLYACTVRLISFM